MMEFLASIGAVVVGLVFTIGIISILLTLRKFLYHE